MRGINNYEKQHLSLLKTVAAEEVNKTTHHQGIPFEHPLMIGVDHYCELTEENKDIPKPPEHIKDETDTSVVVYLTHLHHRKAHAKISGNKGIEKDLEEQLARFKIGNQRWQRMFDNYVEYYRQYPMHQGVKPYYRSWQDPEYGNGNYDYGVVKWKIPSDATVAIIGDIGTGTDVAVAVLLSALSFNPDVILHVGDVYYSGTRREFNNYFVGMIKGVYQDQGVKVPLYTLPGNHEYFTGAVPYFECLDSNDLIFEDSQKQQASFFKLETEDGGWQFLGMDTSYHGHCVGGPKSKLDLALKDLYINPDNVFNPAIPPDMVYLRPDEVDWHHYHLNQHKGRTILLGHHPLYSANRKVGIPQKMKDGKPDPLDYNRPGANTRLWRAFGAYFQKVAAWYWGHEHNLCIYENKYRPEGWPDASDAPDEQFKALAKGRCVGHSAIPVAKGEEPYKINNPIPLVKEDLKLDLYNGWYNRGYEILKLNGSSIPAEATYYQIQGEDPTPMKIYQESII